MQKKHSKKAKYIIFSVFCILALLSAVLLYFPQSGLPSWDKLLGASEPAYGESYPFSAHFIDVGQADCSLIQTEDAVILIDAGDVNSFDTIDAYLQAHNISSIDYFILTHAHADHIGSADDILYHYTVKNVIMPRYSADKMPTSRVYADLLRALQEQKPKIIAAAPGSTYQIGTVSMLILAPNGEYEEMNNSSVVTKITYKNTSFLFQGDAERQSEKDILKKGYPVQADVLKLGHHGSKTSSTEAYLNAVQPSFAVISCGLDNSYNLPSKAVLERLQKDDIPYKRTDLNGTIVVGSDGEKLYLETEKAA